MTIMEIVKQYQAETFTPEMPPHAREFALITFTGGLAAGLKFGSGNVEQREAMFLEASALTQGLAIAALQGKGVTDINKVRLHPL